MHGGASDVARPWTSSTRRKLISVLETVALDASASDVKRTYRMVARTAETGVGAGMSGSKR